MLKGDVFAEQVFENQIFALFINTFLNGNDGVASDYKNAMALTYTGKVLNVASGAVCIQGRFLEESTSYQTTMTEVSKYHILTIEIDLDKTNTAQNFTQGYYKLLTGNSAYPSLTKNDIVKNVSGVYQYELCRFQTDSNGNITNFQDKRTFLDINSIYDAIEASTTTLINSLNTQGTAAINQIRSNGNQLISDLTTELQQARDGSLYALKTDEFYQIANPSTTNQKYIDNLKDMIVYPGYITNNIKDIVFTIPLPKKANGANLIVVNHLYIKARCQDGYVAGLNDSDSYDQKNRVEDYYIHNNILTIKLHNNSGWSVDSDVPTPMKNNTPIMITAGNGSGIDITIY